MTPIAQLLILAILRKQIARALAESKQTARQHILETLRKQIVIKWPSAKRIDHLMFEFFLFLGLIVIALFLLNITSELVRLNKVNSQILEKLDRIKDGL